MVLDAVKWVKKSRRMSQDGGLGGLQSASHVREPRRDGIYPGREDVGRQWDGVTRSRVAESNELRVICMQCDCEDTINMHDFGCRSEKRRGCAAGNVKRMRCVSTTRLFNGYGRGGTLHASLYVYF